MIKRFSLYLIFAALLGALLAPVNLLARPLNVVLILADDLGWTDLACFGSQLYETPNIDRLARDGMKFTQAYAACCVCSPTRAAILTGKYPARLHITDWIPGLPPSNPKLLVPDFTKYLPLEEETIAEAFHAAGYATASMGKWHLGGPEYWPEKHGFDLNLAGTDAPRPNNYFAPYNIVTLPEGPEGEYITDRLGVEAARWIEQRKEKPFFLYLPHFAVHLPLQARKDVTAKYRKKIQPGMMQTNAIYAAMIESLDDAVGRVRKQLEELNLADHTLVVFASDNGGRVPTTSNLPLRVGKGSCYEGGTRVPLIIHWPGVTKPGGVCDTPVITTDLVPTLLEAAGVKKLGTLGQDGQSLAPLLRGSGKLNRDELFWHYPHYQHYQLGGTTPYGAIRKGDFKLIEFFDDMRVELYDLGKDIGEQRNLATQMPKKADELRNRLHAWRAEVGAQMPARNPNHDPTKPEHIPSAPRQSNSSLLPLSGGAAEISLVPEKVPCVVIDRQDCQSPDRVHLSGWLGARVLANESNRLAKLDPARLLEGFRQRPGRQIWEGEHVGKWMHAATLAWANTGDPALRQHLDYVAAELVKCQLPDGYLGTYLEKDRWTLWDVWAHKYNLIGLVTYMRFTGNMEPLPACRRMADLLCNTFGDAPGKKDIILAGQHMGMAPTSVLEPMILLYRLTGEPRYLDFSKYILRAWEHPNGPKIVSTLLDQKRVDKVGNGKAYEMLSCLNGALEYHRTVNDPKILQACLNAWQDIVDRRLYLTGTASYREFFHDDFDLPNLSNVGETCVTVTWLQFNAQLLRLTGQARFAEQLERTVLNQLFGAQSCDGAAWGYYVQMEGKKPYSSTLEGHCCLSSGPRGVALIPTFTATTDPDGIVVNLYESGTARLNLRDHTSVTLTTQTQYPADGSIRLLVNPAAPKSFAIKLRIPAWCAKWSVEINQKTVDATPGPDGYVALRNEWKTGDTIQLQLALQPRLVVGTHKNQGKLAVCFGPLVLAADEALLGGQDRTLNALGVPGPDLAALRVQPEPAPGDLKFWSGARVFRINALARKPMGQLPAKTPLQIRLIPFAEAGATGTAYKIWLPYAEPRPDRNLLMDGVEIRSRKPNIGSIIDGNPETIAATFSNKRAQDDWFGVVFQEPVTIKRVIFFHGKTFHDGGWFDTSTTTPYVQIQAAPDAKWQTVGQLRGYPATTAASPAGLKGGESFTCDLPHPVTAFGVRVVGKPSSGDNPEQAFSSCAELQAFGPL